MPSIDNVAWVKKRNSPANTCIYWVLGYFDPSWICGKWLLFSRLQIFEWYSTFISVVIEFWSLINFTVIEYLSLLTQNYDYPHWGLCYFLEFWLNPLFLRDLVLRREVELHNRLYLHFLLNFRDRYFKYFQNVWKLLMLYSFVIRFPSWSLIIQVWTLNLSLLMHIF